MKIKSLRFYFFISLLLFSLIANSFLISAVNSNEIDKSQEQKTANEASEGFDYYMPSFLKNLQVSRVFLLFFLFALFFSFIFASLLLIDFPPMVLLKIGLSVLLTFVLTWLIPLNDFVTSLMGFQGVFISIYLTIPILILSFISYILATKLKSFFGVFLQRFMWLCYSFYLLLKSLTLGRGFIGPIVAEKMDFLPNWVATLIAGPKASFGLFILHIVMFVFVFYFFVWRNKDIIEILEKQMQRKKFEKYNEKMKRADAKRNVWAEA